jgi:hypothetical protein
MSNTHVPVKTPLGQQELRQRSKALGQRHRTVLLLVDGRRPLAEVLSMAHQAGAMTAHFEELVRLGMVELPVPPPAEPPKVESAPSTEWLVEYRVEPSPQEPGAQPAEPAAEPTPETRDQAHAGLPAGLPGAAAAANPDVEPPPVEPVPAPAPADRPAPALELARRPRRKPAAVRVPRRPELPNAVPPLPELAPEALPLPAPEPAMADLPPAEAHRLDEARLLLIDILRRDTLLHRLLAPARVRHAKTQEALIALVWEIERERAHAHRKRVQLIALQRARELLGMGNTLVAEDTLPFLPTQQP